MAYLQTLSTFPAPFSTSREFRLSKSEWNTLPAHLDAVEWGFYSVILYYKWVDVSTSCCLVYLQALCRKLFCIAYQLIIMGL